MDGTGLPDIAGFTGAGRIGVQAGDDRPEPVMIRKFLSLLLLLLIPTLAGCDLASFFSGGCPFS